MKIALTCDHLLNNDHFVQSLSSLLEIFPDAPIYTLAHRRGKVPSILQERTIHASALSHKVSNTEQLLARSWAAPSVASRLSIPCSTDLTFSLSAGLGHGFKQCQKTRQITYLYQAYNPGSGLKQKFFSSYLHSWSRKKLTQSDQLWVSSPTLLEFCRQYHPNPKLVNPGFKVECFLRPSPLTQPSFFAVNGPITESLKQILKQCPFPWKLLESSEVLKSSFALISPWTDVGFPKRALESLALGNPVIIRNTPINRDVLQPLENKGVVFIEDPSQILSALKKCPSFPCDPAPLRSLALQYSESRFKSNIRRLLRQIVQ